MKLFDRLVAEAVGNNRELASLQVVVEKELLHHDILREMGAAGLLHGLTFIGGTCLRACYGSSRLSEDLDFTGGSDFSREQLAGFGIILTKRLEAKYNLKTEVSEPVREKGNVATWKLKVITHPQHAGTPAQKIHIDICAINSYQRQPMLLRNNYGVDMGTSGLIIQAQSREEILADKVTAFGLRRNRLKNRDLWDIGWLRQQGVELPRQLMGQKAADHGRSGAELAELLESRSRQLDSPEVREEFIYEMRRFLPPGTAKETVEKPEFWIYLRNVIQEECSLAVQALGKQLPFIM